MTRVHRRALGTAAVFTLIATAGAVPLAEAAGAAMCGPHKQIRQILSDRYQESARGLGLVSDRGVVELFISKAGTWSIVMTMATGSTCIIAAGHTWQELAAEIEGPAV